MRRGGGDDERSRASIIRFVPSDLKAIKLS